MLETNSGEPLHVSVKSTNKVYLVIEQGTLPSLDEDFIRNGLAHAAAQAERGEIGDWNADEIKAAGRERLARIQRDS
jgi:hypothetical protein